MNSQLEGDELEATAVTKNRLSADDIQQTHCEDDWQRYIADEASQRIVAGSTYLTAVIPDRTQ